MKRVLESLRKICVILIINILIINIIPLQAIAIEDYDLEKINRLQDKIAKNYSNKFCNAIGIGVSKDGAIRLAINENKESKFNPSLWFELASSGEKNLDLIDQNDLTEIISTRIIRDCGLAIGLSGEKGIESFKDYFKDVRSELKE